LGGGRTRKTFKNRQDAETYLDLARIQVQNYGMAAMTISDALRNEAIKCDELLAPFGKSITDASQFYLDHLKAISASQSVKHVIAALRAGRKADSRSIRYLRDLKYRLGKFEEDFGERQIAEITNVEIENWLRALNLAPVFFHETHSVVASSPCLSSRKIAGGPGAIPSFRLQESRKYRITSAF
jgi:hypothetical protein